MSQRSLYVSSNPNTITVAYMLVFWALDYVMGEVEFYRFRGKKNFIVKNKNQVI